MDMPFHHRRLSGPLICVLLNALGLIPVSHAQEDRLKELQARVVSLQTAGNYAEAIDTAKEVLVVAEATYGAEDVRITESLNNLATLYDDPSNKDHGEFGEAEPLLKRVLAIDEKSLGPNHPDVATSLNNLASFYYQQRKYAEAEPLQKRALAIDEKSLGPNHPNVTRDLGYLATLYNSQGRYAEVEPLLKRVLAIDELGPDYPKVAGDLGNLAMFYNSLGEYGESEPLLKRVLAIDEKALGPNHPDVARDLGYLAFAYTNLSKYAEPESLYKRALAIDEKALGPDHPYVAGILNVFATFYMDQSKYAEAEPLYKRSIAIYEKSLGPDHPNVAVVVCNLGVLYYSQQKYGEAESLLKRALAIDEKAPGPDDQNVARDLNDLSNIYTSQGKYAEAEPLLKRAVAAAESTGPDRPGSATFLANLAVLDNAQGKYAEAESLLKRAIPMMEEWLGPDSPYTTQGLTTMAVTYLGEGRPAEAGSSYDKALQSLSGQFRYSFTYMSEKERLQFLGQVENIFPAYFSFCITHSKQDPSLPGKMYDVLLWEKGMVGVSVASLGRQISISGDAQAIKLFEDLTRKKIESARLGTLRPPEWQEKKKVLDSEANNLEAELARRANSTAEQEMLASATWRDVQKKLRPGDAAVEVVRFNFYELFGLAHAVLGLEHFTDKSYYVGLVLTPKSTNGPILVPLGETPNLEGRSLEDYRRFVSAQSAEYSQDAASIPGQALYRAFWSPLERALGGGKDRLPFSRRRARSGFTWNLTCERWRATVFNLRLARRFQYEGPVAVCARLHD
jgi:tetratricopeptide (TPR) repeat protein